MNQRKKLCNLLCYLLDFRSYKKIGKRCTGKWRGTTDYSLVFDDKYKLFVSNGMSYFNERLTEFIKNITDFEKNKKEILQKLQFYSIQDNETATKEGLKTTKILDIGVIKDSDLFLLWPYILMEVDGIQFRFIETGLKEAMFKNIIDHHYNRYTEIFTAGAVEKPTFVFHNVRFSHLDDLYKI